MEKNVPKQYRRCDLCRPSERYALTVTPLLVLAQRKLLERIRANGGSKIPQPHHVKTRWTTGKEVTRLSVIIREMTDVFQSILSICVCVRGGLFVLGNVQDLRRVSAVQWVDPSLRQQVIKLCGQVLAE